MATISIYANTAFGAETFSWKDPVHSWKAGPGEVMTVENKQTEKDVSNLIYLSGPNQYKCQILYRKNILLQNLIGRTLAGSRWSQYDYQKLS